jgi:hypothetical protein
MMCGAGASSFPSRFTPMTPTIVQARSKSELRQFLTLPWSIYKGDRNWVPPLLKEVREALSPTGTLAKDSVQAHFLALVGGQPAGRISVGIDLALNARKNTRVGHFSLFECVNDRQVTLGLFDAATSWLAEQQIAVIKGPISPGGSRSDDYKGLLIDGFDRPPVVLTSYNPDYYQGLIEGCGFEKDLDVFAYYLDKDLLFLRDPVKVLHYAERRYNLNVRPIDMKNLEEEIGAIKHILDLAVPAEWPDLVPPSLEEVREMGLKLKPLADPDLIVLARAGDEPVGLGIALPDYNQVLIRLNGRMTPLAMLKYLWLKRKIDCARIFALFVVPAFRRKGVAHALYFSIFKNGTGKGYVRGEGSTIGETNVQMLKDIESIGGQRYKTYRIFGRDIA